MGRNKDKVDHVYENVYMPAMANGAQGRQYSVTMLYTDMLMSMAVGRIKWHGLPKGIDERFLEMVLLGNRLALFYLEESVDRFVVTRATPSGNINLYDNPVDFTTVSNGGLNSRRVKAGSDGVPIWCNLIRRPEMPIITLYANRLAQFDRTIDINMMQQRHPFIVAANEHQRLSYHNAMRQVQDGKMDVMVSEDFDINAIQALNTGIDKDLVLNGITSKKRIWSEALSFLGIDNNSSDDKTERMVVDEVKANAGAIIGIRNSLLAARNTAADIINDIYGLQISAEWRMDSEVVTDMPDFNDEPEIVQ